MNICPLCNGLAEMDVNCRQCNQKMDDKGKLIDYFDDYSAYLDTDGMKKFDGFSQDLELHQCPHVFYCEHCHIETTILIQESDYLT